MAITAGAHFGRYEVRSLLGTGGMGEVYLVQDTQLRRQVALKLLPADFAADQDRLHRFEREAHAASSLNHPNILTIYEFGEVNGHHFIATEFIDGESLRQKLMKGTPLLLGECIDIGLQVASALAAAHAAGIVHRDIKPENIMMRHDGYVKVLDFGLAKMLEKQKPSLDTQADTRKMVQQTSPGVVMGTASYMSPEQARGIETDARTDIWSLGVVLYELLAGSVPFAGNSMSDVIAAIIYKDPVPLVRFARNCPAELERIVTKALQKDREERYQSVKDLGLDLKSLRRRLEFEAELERSVAPDKPEPASQPIVSSGPTTSVVPNVSTSSGRNRDALLLTEFTNLTNDPVFDGTLKMALAVTLEQSPFLDIFAETRVRQTLRLMGRSADEPVTRDVGREICQRQGLKAYIAGSISSIGTTYVLMLEALSAQTGETLGRQLEQAESKEGVLKALGQAATGLREKLGESLSSIEKFDAALELTTSSLEALKLYSLGREQGTKGQMLEAVPFFVRALEFDPEFAYAYVALAIIYNNTSQPKLAAEYMTKAFELRERVSEFEKLRITNFYYSYVTGETDKRIETLELCKRTYPRDYRVFNNLSDCYDRIGRFEKAEQAAREGLRLDSNTAVGYTNLAEPLLSLNRFAEVKEICNRAFELKLDGDCFHIFLYQVAFIEDDAAMMANHFAWFSGKHDEYVALNLQTGAAGFRGQWRGSQSFSRRAIDLANRSNAKGIAAQYAAEQSLRIVLWSSGTGLPSPDDAKLKLALRTQTQNALRLERDKITLSRTALALSLAGQIADAQTLARELETEYPKDTLVNQLWLPTIRATLELQSGKADDAIELLEPAERFERAAEFYPQYIRGLAHLKLERGAEASIEFQKILNGRGESPLSVLYPLAQLGLARALAMTTDVERSRKAYEDFFEMWKDADKDMPLLVAAKSEFENRSELSKGNSN